MPVEPRLPSLRRGEWIETDLRIGRQPIETSPLASAGGVD